MLEKREASASRLAEASQSIYRSLTFRSLLKPERGSRRRNHRKDIPPNSAAFSPDLYCELVHSTRVNSLAAAALRPR